MRGVESIIKKVSSNSSVILKFLDKVSCLKNENRGLRIYDTYWLYTSAPLEGIFALFQKDFHHIKVNNYRFAMEKMDFMMRDAL